MACTFLNFKSNKRVVKSVSGQPHRAEVAPAKLLNYDISATNDLTNMHWVVPTDFVVSYTFIFALIWVCLQLFWRQLILQSFLILVSSVNWIILLFILVLIFTLFALFQVRVFFLLLLVILRLLIWLTKPWYCVLICSASLSVKTVTRNKIRAICCGGLGCAELWLGRISRVWVFIAQVQRWNFYLFSH